MAAKWIDPGELVGRRVVVYRNLTAAARGEVVWSVAAATSTGGRGRLVGHVRGLELVDVSAVVSGRALTVNAAGGPREVCAWLVGTVVDADGWAPAATRVGFDLYRADGPPVFTAGGVPFTAAARATFAPAGCHVDGARL